MNEQPPKKDTSRNELANKLKEARKIDPTMAEAFREKQMQTPEYQTARDEKIKAHQTTVAERKIKENERIEEIRNELAPDNKEREQNLEQGFTEELTKVQANSQEISKLIEQKGGIISPKAKEVLIKIAKAVTLAGLVGGASDVLFSGGLSIIETIQHGSMNKELMEFLFSNIGGGAIAMVLGGLATDKLEHLETKLRNKLSPKVGNGVYL